MSRRAEEAALQRYALKEVTAMNVKLHDEFKAGYELAEEDLALTLEDVRTLFKIADNYEDDAIEKPPYLSQEYCEEVLRRFNEYKSK